jgi:hypothetical protein
LRQNDDALDGAAVVEISRFHERRHRFNFLLDLNEFNLKKSNQN